MSTNQSATDPAGQLLDQLRSLLGEPGLREGPIDLGPEVRPVGTRQEGEVPHVLGDREVAPGFALLGDDGEELLGRERTMSTPVIEISPEVGRGWPAIGRRRFVVPAPLGPSTATLSPGETARSIPSFARWAPERPR